MTTQSEASRLNLEYYRKQAKALLKSAQSGDAAARERLSRLAAKSEAASPKLHDAQLTIAREQGFTSWPRFRAFIIQSGLDDRELIAAFIEAATTELRRAHEILSAHPQIADAGFYVDLVLGNRQRISRTLAETPGSAIGKGGPGNCEPLVYVCFSHFGRAGRAADLAETARLLLQRGANPNAFIVPEGMPDIKLSCLYAATGLHNNPALCRLLLEAGADPNDGESLYHATEHPDLECMKLLLAHGAKPGVANALRHILDREDLAGVRVLLAAAADPNDVNDRGETCLHWAMWRGRSASIIGALLDGGANANLRRNDGRTAYALAVQSGLTEVTALMEARGAATDVSSTDRLLGAYAAGGPVSPIVLSPGDERILPDLAANHRTQAVQALLAAGVPIDARGDHGATALHWACWQGYADLVELLLNHGASLTIEDEQFHGTPVGWFSHGVSNCNNPDGDYPRVAHLLTAAGATIPSP